MSKNIGTLVGAPIRITDSDDQYAAAFQSEIKGGHHSRATLVLRDAIGSYLREAGMTCYVAETLKTYELGTDLVTWTVKGSGTATLNPWQGLTGISAQVDTQQLQLLYKTDGADDAGITHIAGQFCLKSTFVGTSLTIGTLPVGSRPPAQFKRYAITQNVEHYIIVETTGELKLLSKDEFSLPVGTDEAYSIQLFFKPNAGVVVPPDPTTYTATRTANFTRNNCNAGSSGSVVAFTKDYTSTVSQAAAEALADANFNADGQANANANGQCTVDPPIDNNIYYSVNIQVSQNPSYTNLFQVTASLLEVLPVPVQIVFSSTYVHNNNLSEGPQDSITINAGQTNAEIFTGTPPDPLGTITDFQVTILNISPSQYNGRNLVLNPEA